MGIKHETVTVGGLVAYCDGCGAHGPETAYDNHNDLAEQMEMEGWEEDGDGRITCVDCVSKAKKPAKKTAKRAS